MAGKRNFTYTPSFVIGLLLVPLSAVAAFALVANQQTSDPSDTATPATTVAAPAVEVVAAVTTITEPQVEADLTAACGEDGMKLVEAEADQTIGDLEQAALDALRPICAEAGMELPGPPAPAPVVRTVRVTSGGSSGADSSSDGGSTSGGTYDDDHSSDDDHYDDDEHDEDDEDDEDDHHEDDDDGRGDRRGDD